MILHIFNDQKKFSKDYFKLLKEYQLELKEHVLIHYGKKDDFFEEKIGIETFFIRSFFSIIKNIYMLRYLFKAEKIIIHSLASPYLILYIILFNKISKKSIWFIWGKDLYFYKLNEKPNIFDEIYEFFRKKAIVKINFVISGFRKDVELLNEWYNSYPKAIIYQNAYANSVNRDLHDINDSKTPYTICVGNSASKTNRHEEIFYILSNKKFFFEKMYVPLSYGSNKKYIKKIIKLGEELFGDKFIPLTKFMEKESYFNLIKNVDLFIYNHHRQEGVGNVYTQVLDGKTVYISKQASTTEFLEENNLLFYYTEDIEQNNLKSITYNEKISNRNKMLELLKIENAIKFWKKIFELEIN